MAGARQLFHYDAFGNALGFDPALAATLFLYSGEQTDRTGLQYLRARYYDPAVGRFNSLDPAAGDWQDPQSLHKYLYCHADPVLGVDPTGLALGLLTRYGISIKNSLTALAAIDRLQNAVEIGQVVLQLALTGTANPLDVANIALNIMPGAAMFKRLKMFIPPFRRTTNVTHIMEGASKFLTGIAKHPGFDTLGRDIYKNVNGNWAKFRAVWTRYIENVGELGGGLVARRMGLDKVESYVKRGIHGFDGIYKKGNKYFILEAIEGRHIQSCQTANEPEVDREEHSQT